MTPYDTSYQISREDLQLLLALAAQNQQSKQGFKTDLINLLQSMTPLLQLAPTIIESSVDIHLARAKNKVLAAQITGARQYAQDMENHIRRQDGLLDDQRDAGRRDWEISRNKAYLDYKQAKYDTNNAKMYAGITVLCLTIINNLPQIIETVEKVCTSTVNFCKKAWNWITKPKTKTVEKTTEPVQKIDYVDFNDSAEDCIDNNCVDTNYLENHSIKTTGDNYDWSETAAAA